MENLQPKIGDRVRVRQRTWVVQDVDTHQSCRVVTLRSDAHDGPATIRRVLHPFDDIEPTEHQRRTRLVGARAWHRAFHALGRSHGGATSLRAVLDARMDLLPFQLEPALSLVAGHGTRFLLADDVGLGKTMQALLCAGEMRARGLGTRVLVLTPAGLREQWVYEAEARVGLPLRLVDQLTIRRLAATLPPDINPWTTEPCVVASIDYVKRPEVLPLVRAAAWDMVIVDEAHGSCGDSDRRDAVSAIASRALFVILLSATPHNGDEHAFSSLCHLGRLDEELVVFRRSRTEAGRDRGRRVHTLRVRPSPAERRMHAAVASLTRAIRHERAELSRDAWLLLSLLHKRALSSAHALAASVERRLQCLDDAPTPSGAQLPLPLDDETGELDGGDAPPMWNTPVLDDRGLERRLFQQVLDAAREAQGCEAKLRRLRRLLQSVHEPVIVFTEYRDTLLYLRTQVASEAVVIHGGMSRDQRRAALEQFRAGRVLLATDAAGEGLNLHHECRTVINLELPWNPMRLEQRIGRVDRIGQRRRVHVVHLIANGTGEMRLLDRLAARVTHAQDRVAAPNPLGGRAEWTEEASAAIVVLRRSSEHAGPATSTLRTPPVHLTRLVDEALREAERIECVRAFAGNGRRRSVPGVSAEPGRAASAPLLDTLVLRARRRTMRRALRGRRLLVFRSQLLDASGRAVATHVLGVLADTGLPHDSAIRAGAAAAARAAAESHHDSVQAHHRLTATQLRRARAIARLCRPPGAEEQPGLFDRRVEHLAAARGRAVREERTVAEERLARIATAARVCIAEPELMLVAVPRPDTWR
ncbi:MAG: DEAD/DEAH box helicase [Acidobacteria bacterium]|nr:DEAD/DEAH box helicase [Acidobacteriota bacterium]